MFGAALGGVALFFESLCFTSRAFLTQPVHQSLTPGIQPARPAISIGVSRA